ncbi:MAG: hypothetical protein ACRBC3_02585 [Burkholderiaceae bacterium]
MKPVVRVASILAAVSMASAVNAADSGVTRNADLETKTSPDNYEIQDRRDALEARPPISSSEKKRLQLEAAENRPGPDEKQ